MAGDCADRGDARARRVRAGVRPTRQLERQKRQKRHMRIFHAVLGTIVIAALPVAFFSSVAYAMIVLVVVAVSGNR